VCLSLRAIRFCIRLHFMPCLVHLKCFLNRGNPFELWFKCPDFEFVYLSWLKIHENLSHVDLTPRHVICYRLLVKLNWIIIQNRLVAVITLFVSSKIRLTRCLLFNLIIIAINLLTSPSTFQTFLKVVEFTLRRLFLLWL